MLTDGTLQLSDNPKSKPSPEAEAELRKRFNDMIKVLHAQQGASFAISILDEQATRDFVAEHSAILDEAVSTGIAKVGMSELMRQRISESNYVFSGIKTFHELNEAFPLLTDENGDRKPFERFLNDVQKIDESYNRNYLRAEYNFVNASAEMAGRWEQIAADGDRYDLQYRTAGDDRVRPEHAQLDGITLPPSNRFWDDYFPPNGWNCRCTAVQVRRGKYPNTDVGEAYKRGNEALAKDKKGMFRFNPGKQQRAIPKYNPYTISDCTNCNKIKLASKLPANQLCEVCQAVNEQVKDNTKSQAAITRSHYMREMEPLLKRQVKVNGNGHDMVVGFRKCGNKHLYSDTFTRSRVLTADDLPNIDKLLSNAIFVGKQGLSKVRKDDIKRFYYYKASLHGKNIYINVAELDHQRANGKIKHVRYVYSVTDKIKNNTE